MEVTNTPRPEFRFWDPFNEVMTYSEGYKLSKFFEMFEKTQEGDNKPILMRGSGEKDDNGKEIFEGDTFHHLVQGQSKYEVFLDGSFLSFRYKLPHGNYYIWGNFHRGLLMLQEYNGLRVVGNIYQNPE